MSQAPSTAVIVAFLRGAILSGCHAGPGLLQDAVDRLEQLDSSDGRCPFGKALQELLAAIGAAPTVTWTKAEGSTNTYHTLHADTLAEWLKKWGHLLQ